MRRKWKVLDVLSSSLLLFLGEREKTQIHRVGCRMSGGNYLPPCFLAANTLQEDSHKGRLGAWNTEAINRVKEVPDPIRLAGAIVAEARPWRRPLLQGSLARQQWPSQHAHPLSPQATASTKAEATGMTSASRLGSRRALEAPFCGRSRRQRCVPECVGSCPQVGFLLPCSVRHSFASSLTRHKTLPTEDVKEA